MMVKLLHNLFPIKKIKVNYNHSRSIKSKFITKIRTLIILITLFNYGIALFLFKLARHLPFANYWLLDAEINFYLQGVLAIIFPEIAPAVFFSLYLFIYRVEVMLLILTRDKSLHQHVVTAIQQLRRSPMKPLRFVGRVGAAGFMGGVPQMPKGNGPGLFVWGTVVVIGLGMGYTRKHFRDRMIMENQRLDQANQRENERLHNTQQNTLEGYKIQTENTSRWPFWRKKPPKPPKF